MKGKIKSKELIQKLESQELFDKLYKNEQAFLSDSTTISVVDMIEGALNKMYFQENKNIKEIQKILRDRLESFKKTYIEE